MIAYHIIMTFDYSNGKTGGKLETIVKRKAHVERQLDYDRAWLSAHGHTETGLTIYTTTHEDIPMNTH